MSRHQRGAQQASHTGLLQPNLPINISADASLYRLGAVMLQESHSVLNVQIKNEALATAWVSAKDLQDYIIGVRIHKWIQTLG